MREMRGCEVCGEPIGRNSTRACSVKHGALLRRGAANCNFNGGLHQRKSDGRWVIVCRDGSLMMFYRGVMAAHVGRLLTPAELVHHRNEDPSDDRLENLEITTRRDHMEHHRPAIMAGRGL